MCMTQKQQQKISKLIKDSKYAALDEIAVMLQYESLFQRSARNNRTGLDNKIMSFSATLSAYRSQINLKTGS